MAGRATRPFRFGSEDRPDPDPPLGVGSVVGARYRIVGLLGEGGMGRVYEAQHIVLRRRVALKLLRRDAAASGRDAAAAEENLARFRQEALAASRIGAPEIVEVVDFASHAIAGGEQTYMVMELLAGESLEDWMVRSAQLDEGLTILASLCDGLAAAHRAAVVHRDIKPANVFLPRADPTLGAQVRVKILDFGIAKITASGEGFQTRQGSLLGTPYYLAPERIMGAELTGAADVYSVGVILFEMLTGNVPFVADSFMGILANHVHTAPLDPRQAAPDRPIPAEVAQLCLRLLSKEPRERPSAEAVAVELRGLLAQDARALAAVEIGPRGSSEAGADSQIISEGTHEVPLADRPTQVPVVAPSLVVEPGEPSRSSTKIGHASIAAEAPGGTLALSSSTPVVVTPATEPSGIGRGIGIGLGASLGAAVIAVALWLAVGSDDEPVARGGELAEPVAEVEEPPVEVGPVEHEGTSGSATTLEQPVEVAAEQAKGGTAPVPESKPVEAVEREHREASHGEAHEPERPPKPKPDPKPTPESEDAPAPTPEVDPPQPDPPAPKPEPDPELPTIKDDVYD